VWGTGKPVREWLYVDDGAERWLGLLTSHPIGPNQYWTWDGISVRDLAEMIKAGRGSEESSRMTLRSRTGRHTRQ